MIKINNGGNVLYYKKDDNNPFFYFKKYNIEGKVRYLYIKNGNMLIAGSFYGLGNVVILDENYNESDKVTLKDNSKVNKESGVEKHDFIMIDDWYYIV